MFIPSISKNSNAYQSKNIHFNGEYKRQVEDIDYEEYNAMSENKKKRLRKIYENFDKKVDSSELFDSHDISLPLKTEKTVEEFIKTASIYNQYKNQPIISLGRSPKWFLNAALWMKNGIKDYKFVAFSKYWFRPDPEEGMVPIKASMPTESEEKAYRKYLKSIKADPASIVNTYEKTGNRTVITDYICTGKGMTSFLDEMSKFAKEQNVLEKFVKAFEIVGIGCKEYMSSLFRKEIDEINPKVIMPPLLEEFESKYYYFNDGAVPQKFYDMDISMFKEMLLNSNTNECRSTYYPHDAWNVYRPDRFKTGLIKNIKKIEELVKNLSCKKAISSFSPAMRDFRNLLNFRILDVLYLKDLLKVAHKSKI